MVTDDQYGVSIVSNHPLHPRDKVRRGGTKSQWSTAVVPKWSNVYRFFCSFRHMVGKMDDMFTKKKTPTRIPCRRIIYGYAVQEKYFHYF